MAPVRRLEGVAYWAIEGPAGVKEFIDVALRKEWEADLVSPPRPA